MLSLSFYFMPHHILDHISAHIAEPLRPPSTIPTTTIFLGNETDTKNTTAGTVTKDGPKIEHLNMQPNAYGNRIGVAGFGLHHGYDKDGAVQGLVYAYKISITTHLFC